MEALAPSEVFPDLEVFLTDDLPLIRGGGLIRNVSQASAMLYLKLTQTDGDWTCVSSVDWLIDQRELDITQRQLNRTYLQWYPVRMQYMRVMVVAVLAELATYLFRIHAFDIR